jgi:tRNA nucleotidyltransferase/poly(A) polymerase
MECIEILNIDRSFDLYEIEKKIFEYLKKVVRNRCKNVELRVAGGWVRDKVN